MRDIKTFKNAEYIKHFKHIFINYKLTKDKKSEAIYSKNQYKAFNVFVKGI